MTALLPDEVRSPGDAREPIRVVAVSGSIQAPSKTTALVREIATAVAGRRNADVHLIELIELGPKLAGAIRRSDLPPDAEAELRAIEEADLLIAGTPVYRASFTGLFKHLFDFVGQYALIDTPVLLAATGGSDRHALTIEHQLRPLFGFFQALTLPIGVYASDRDFTDYAISDPDLIARIDTAVERALPLLGHRPVEAHPSRW